jgi:hypothetical protein
MKTPAELAARLRKMALAAQHHYSPTGEPLRSIVVSPEWLEVLADAAHALERKPMDDQQRIDAYVAMQPAGWLNGGCEWFFDGIAAAESFHGITPNQGIASPPIRSEDEPSNH